MRSQTKHKRNIYIYIYPFFGVGGGLVVNNNDIGVNISNNLVYHDNAYDLVKIPEWMFTIWAFDCCLYIRPFDINTDNLKFR